MASLWQNDERSLTIVGMGTPQILLFPRSIRQVTCLFCTLWTTRPNRYTRSLPYCTLYCSCPSGKLDISNRFFPQMKHLENNLTSKGNIPWSSKTTRKLSMWLWPKSMCLIGPGLSRITDRKASLYCGYNQLDFERGASELWGCEITCLTSH